MIRIRPSRAASLVAAGLLIAALTTDAPSGAAPPTISGPVLPLGHTGTWLTDTTGRVVVLHGLNQVYKVPPYEPSADGFGDDDAAFLAANGFNAMRLGVIWAAVEPQPGTYDDAYLASIAQTVQTLGAHGIVSLLDFHQDLYSKGFASGGQSVDGDIDGAPAWAVQTGGLPNPQLSDHYSYYVNPAEEHAWGAFWRNAKAPDGIGLQDHLAHTEQHTAAYFRNNPNVLGYEILNEPWRGPLWPLCVNPLVGCPVFDATKLTNFYNRVVSAIRAANPTTPVFFEANQLFNLGIPTGLGTVADQQTGFAFHDYCVAQALAQSNFGCPFEDGFTFAHASDYAAVHHIPTLLTEFGSANTLANLTEVMAYADQHRMGWLEWTYSAAAEAEELVFDPSQPPTGSNVNTAKLAVLAEPYPQVVAGTPKFWSFTSGTFRLGYSTDRPDHRGRFSPGAQTLVSVPPVEYPSGYHVTVNGGQVVSAPNAPVLTVLANAGADTVNVVVTP